MTSRPTGYVAPITLYEGKVLDGRNRMIACDWAWKELLVEAYDGDDPVGFVISKNLHRRHLTESQRAMIAAKLANMSEGRPNKTTRIRAVSQGKAGELLSVGHRTVSDANTVLKSGDTGLIEAVQSGKMKVDPAARLVRAKRAKPTTQPPKRQRGPLPEIKSLQPLTREEVDPEFQGSAIDWTDKYGHVQIMTAERYATERFGAWASNLGAISKEAKRMPDWPNVDHNWLRSPRARDIAKLVEALDYLRPKIAEAEALLERVQAALPPPHQPDAESLLTE